MCNGPELTPIMLQLPKVTGKIPNTILIVRLTLTLKLTEAFFLPLSPFPSNLDEYQPQLPIGIGVLTTVNDNYFGKD